MKKVKVAFCLRDMQLGGVESVLVRMLDELACDKNFDITLVTFVNLSEPLYQDWLKSHKNIKHIVLYPWKFFGTKMPRFFLWRIIKHLLRDLYRFIGRNLWVHTRLKNFDTLVDFHDFGFAGEFKKVKDVKKIAWFHSSIDVFIGRHFINRVGGYDKVVVLTHDCTTDLRNLYSAHSHKFIHIYNMLDIQNIKKMATHKSPIDGGYFCCVSRMSNDKDIKTVLSAFDSFCIYHQDTKLVLVGGGDKLDEYKNYAAELKSAKKIKFVGAQQNPYVYMANAHANILSSYGEGLAMVLVEAQSLGVVNIASDCKYGPREILLNGRGGLLFTPGDVRGLARCMLDVYENNVDVDKMVRASSMELGRFDKDEIIKSVKSLIS